MENKIKFDKQKRIAEKTRELALFYSENANNFSKKDAKKYSLFRYCSEEDIPRLSKMPLELYKRGESIAKQKGLEREFLLNAFKEGCIAKKVNALSKWIAMNE